LNLVKSAKRGPLNTVAPVGGIATMVAKHFLNWNSTILDFTKVKNFLGELANLLYVLSVRAAEKLLTLG
jgi:hypothetical protein